LNGKGLIIKRIPSPQVVRNRLGDALREVQLLRRLLRLADLAEKYRTIDQRAAGRVACDASCRETIPLHG
jgi:hypothetical protein